MKEITLSNGMKCQVDDEDYDKFGHLNWHAEVRKHTVYVGRYWYNKEKGYKSRKRLHRLIMNASPEMDVDHIDHNGLNNQKSNLRICSTMENRRNSKIRKDNRTGFKGVSLFKGRIWKDSKTPVFRARIMVQRKEIGLGYFESAEEAARAYDSKAVELFGEFAHLNFPIQKSCTSPLPN